MEIRNPIIETLRRPDGVTLTLERCGAIDGPGLVFAHGFGQTRRIWRPAMAELATAGWRCVSFDTRGHGDSDWSADGRYAANDFLNDLAAVVDAQPQPPVLVGASMGGLLALGLAGERHAVTPSRALVLVDSTPRMRAPGIERILGFMRAAPEGFANHDEALRAIAAFQPQRDGRRNEADISALLRARGDGRLVWHWDPTMLTALTAGDTGYEPRMLAAAQGVRVPTLLVSGGRSDVVSAATIDEFIQVLPHARHVELAEATHSVVGDAPAAFVGTLREFLASLSQPDASTRPVPVT